jgi:hypothetical protein
MYEERLGPVPKNLYVLHHCDERSCCNPEHLYVGTQKDNMRDMVARGRLGNRGQKSGEGHAMSKLTQQMVDEIRIKRAQGLSLKVLAGLYPIKEAQISRIARGLRWK